MKSFREKQNKKKMYKFLPILFCPFIGKEEIVRILVQNGCYRNLKDMNGDTAYDLANANGNLLNFF